MSRKRLSISRRDFLNGVPIAIGAGLSPSLLVGCGSTVSDTAPEIQNSSNYPPGKLGMRGSHEGSYEVAHELAWQGKTWPTPDEQHEATYDLIVVGGGLSGLGAAYFYRKRFGANKRILILDNHDDFGGHAKRNEFDVDGQTLICYGGSQSIDSPASYTPAARAMFDELGLVPNRFYDYFDRSYFASRGLRERIFFDEAHYGVDLLAESVVALWQEDAGGDAIAAALEAYPISDEGKAALYSLLVEPRDYLEGRTVDEKKDIMRRASYEAFVRDYAGLPEDALVFLRKESLGIWGIGWDAMSAIEGMRLGMPGLYEMGFYEGYPTPTGGEEPYIFHFPDGNASIARMIVRDMIPNAISGTSMEDVVTATTDYDALDRDSNLTKIRLSSTVIQAVNTADGEAVDVTYVREGTPYRVRGRHAVLAGYNHMIPYMCPELPEAQEQAIDYPEKTPLVYVNVAVRNWRSFEAAEASRLNSPQGFYNTMRLDFPVSMGGYEFPETSDQPTVLTMQYIPIVPGQGLNRKQQSLLGRQQLYQMTFEEFESNVIDQLTASLGPYGFDAEADIAGITVNRWPHGYAYEYDEFEDDWSFGSDSGPHIAARQPIGRIHIASSDSEASAYANAAFIAADRAVNEMELS